jgi:hypothetical protein
MKKVKDFLKAINAKLKISEIDGWIAASDLDDVKISDEAVSELEESVKGLLTLEAAKNNAGLKNHFKQDLYNSIKGELLGNVDTQLQTMTGHLFGDEARSDMEKIEFTKDKFKLFQELTDEHQLKKADDKTKIQLDSYKKQIEKNELAYNKKLSIKDDELKKLNDGFNSRLVDSDLKRRLSSQHFADKYNEDDMKILLSEIAIKRINTEAIIKINDKGELSTYDKESPEMEYFVDGSRLSVDDLITKHIGKYLAKSEPKRQVRKEKLPEEKTEETLYNDPGISSLGKGIRAGV